MGDRLDRYKSRHQHDILSSKDADKRQRDFCIREMPALAQRAIEKIDGNEAVESEYEEIPFRDDNGRQAAYAAWRLTTWAPHDLPREVESYSVLVLEDARMVSETRFWSGQRSIEAYNPSRHEVAALNAVSVYAALAHLPRNYYFKEENMGKMPGA